MDLRTPLDAALSTKKEYILALKEMGLRTIEDLLLYFPRAYEDLSQFKKLHEAKEGETVTMKGYLHGIKRVPTKNRKMTLIKATFYDDFGSTCEATWFNQPHLLRTLPMDTPVVVAGKVKYSYGKYTLQSPVVETEKQAQVHTGGLIPVYPQHEIITTKWLREKIHPFMYLTKDIEDILPEDILESEDLMPKGNAIKELHFPTSHKALEDAQKRMAYEELFLVQLNAVKSKKEWKSSRENEDKFSGIKMDVDFVKNFFSTLPFEPTGAQKVAIYEIMQDMEKPFPMIRLLEGDVGSGKTVVAATALLHAVLNGYQAVIMAPTEVLARQHMISMSKFIGEFEAKFPTEKPINIQLLVGSLTPKEKKSVHDGLKNGQVDIAVGTHALVQEAVGFHNLGLAIVDEQHRFGVKQREVLMKHGTPHVLTMTATPIPRTLALVAYGDQDLSVLHEMPPGRQPIETKIVPPEHRTTVYRFVEGKIREGQQVYVICSLVDDSDVLELKSVKKEHERLCEVFPEFKVGLLHGRMKAQEKEGVMAAFKNKEIDILVSTSVIEVGIDVPNATIMLIEDADRFGLSQLHQFRGRVGRGDKKSYCFLYTTSNGQTTFTRLKAMTDFTDGFKLAEIDLQLRGPGEVYGVRQSGIPELQFASLTNGVLVSRVRKAAEHLVENSPTLDKFPRLKGMLVKIRTKLDKA